MSGLLRRPAGTSPAGVAARGADATRGAGAARGAADAADRRPAQPLVSVTADEPGWSFVSFAAYELAPGQSVARPADGEESLVLVLEGSARVRAGARDLGVLGTRASVFDGPPPAVVLVETGADVEVAAAERALVVLASAPGGEVRRTAAISGDEILVEARGMGQTARRIHHLLPPAARAGRLMAFEVFTPAGNWSSFPPHKHDTDDPPRERFLAEVYFYRFARPGGFAVQRVYTPDRSLDETLTVADRDLVLVPRGYHVVGAAPGYEAYYLNVMAGPVREWRFTVDPDHAWLMDWDPARPAAGGRAVEAGGQAAPGGTNPSRD